MSKLELELSSQEALGLLQLLNFVVVDVVPKLGLKQKTERNIMIVRERLERLVDI